jgi:LacI family transcriptional regulator
MDSSTKQRGIRRATITDVAKAAGVSITTVSNVLNNRGNSMADETRQRVEEVIESLGYRPNGVARTLVSRRTATIGLILAEIETSLFLQGLSIIEPLARTAGYNVLVCHASTPSDERAVIDLLLQKEVEGFVFLSASTQWDDAYLHSLVLANVPAVFVNRAMKHAEFDSINWDNASGIAAAVHHLAELGHTRIAHLRGPQQRKSSAERLLGFRRGLEQCGLEYRDAYVASGDYTTSQETWERSTLELLALPSPPSAIIAADDIVGAVCMQTLQRAGFSVPLDVAVMGTDDHEFCSYLNPTLSTIRLPVVEAGQMAIRLLLDRLAGQRNVCEHIMLPTSIVIRQSTGGRA